METRRVFWIGVTCVLLASLVGAGATWALFWRTGVPLGPGEQARMLERAHLPRDFPVHPGARRMGQPAQGGVSYAVNAAVPDVTIWLRDQLRRTGYQVEGSDLEGDDDAEFKQRWLFYYRRVGGVTSSGGIIVRQVGRGAAAPTEVKILSEQDERLKPPPTPTRGARVLGSS